MKGGSTPPTTPKLTPASSSSRSTSPKSTGPGFVSSVASGVGSASAAAARTVGKIAGNNIVLSAVGVAILAAIVLKGVGPIEESVYSTCTAAVGEDGSYGCRVASMNLGALKRIAVDSFGAPIAAALGSGIVYGAQVIGAGAQYTGESAANIVAGLGPGTGAVAAGAGAAAKAAVQVARAAPAVVADANRKGIPLLPVALAALGTAYYAAPNATEEAARTVGTFAGTAALGVGKLVGTASYSAASVAAKAISNKIASRRAATAKAATPPARGGSNKEDLVKANLFGLDIRLTPAQTQLLLAYSEPAPKAGGRRRKTRRYLK